MIQFKVKLFKIFEINYQDEYKIKKFNKLHCQEGTNLVRTI